MGRLRYGWSLSLVLLALAACATPFATTGPLEPAVAVGGVERSPPGMFFESLRPYGNWIWLSERGWVWHPLNVPVGWRPYTHGHWAFTDDGWTWVSDWPWGWASFHYGRWTYNDDYGWVWIPGMEWGPAWVVWRTGGDWIGWAPIPPAALWREGRFERFDWDRIPEWHYAFVRDRDFVDADLRRHVEGPERNVRFFGRTHPTVDYRMADGHVVDRNEMREHLATVLGHPIPQRRLVEVRTPEELEHREQHAHELRVYRPNREELMHQRAPRFESHFQVPSEIRERQRQETEELERRQNQERQAFRQMQRRELREARRPEPRTEFGAPSRPSFQPEFHHEQEAERRTFNEEMERERHRMEASHARENRRYAFPGVRRFPGSGVRPSPAFHARTFQHREEHREKGR
jgi:hypothetical protein